ncbi:LysR family transcriptional regulator [Sphingomonas paeninsulae]|jgi:DNA-binding transcriptional LysR family regulator|uniref:LysR family transcriptional regulator n=1 Tax=Sphingomonas paeninsulae TaxID=2319844 RepID=A0A494TJ95_SPHPE|nr:LysR substrate-binding domain-containing protein [Sphingomonas paeninsulae]AYJ85841.1 LysR family transcriptional regulator [Sphingomonas paeninsulae]
MELRHLRYFVHVAEELHFGRAAARLGMSQPPLSQQIRLLEDQLGVVLLERTSRRVVLTEAGRLFLAEAYKTLEQADHAIDVARGVGKGELGEINVGFMPSVPFTTVVAKALSKFRASYPAVRLNLTEMSRTAQIEGLLTEKIEIAFIRNVYPPVVPEGLEAILLMAEPLVVAMLANHPLAIASSDPCIADLRNEDFILYRSDFGVGFNEHLIGLCALAGYVPKVTQEVTGPFTLLGLVSAGLGITVVTPTLGALHPDNMIFRPLDDPEAISRLWMIRRRGISKAAARFADFVLAART